MRTWLSSRRSLTRWLALAAMLVVGLAVTSCGGAAPQRGWSGGVLDGDVLYFGARDGRLIAVNVADNSREWATPLETGTTTTGLGCSRVPIVVSIYGTPLVFDGLVYVGGYNGKVYSFVPGDTQPDRVLQRVRVGDKDVAIGPIVGSMVADGGQIFFGSGDGRVYCVNSRLQPVWAEPFLTGGKIWSTPAVDNGTVYVGSFDNNLYALNVTDGTKKWEFVTEGAIAASPVVDGDTVYAGSFDRHLYAIDVTDGEVRWDFEARHAFWADPLVVNGMIYAPSLDGKVYVLDAGDGRKVAEVEVGSPVSSSPVVVGDLVVVASEDGRLWTIDTSSNEGRELVSVGEKVFADLTAGGTSVFVHTDRDSLFGVEVATGALRKYEFK